MPLTAPVLTSPLNEGDHLTLDEFMRRWEAMPDLKRAELIDGIVHMPSPISDIHGEFHLQLSWWLASYVAVTPGCAARLASTWLMAKDSAPQPDLALKVLPEYGGQSKLKGKYAAGAPELIVEVSHTTRARDTGKKRSLYERSGVREYLIVRPKEQHISWLELAQGKYHDLKPDADGLLQSRIFPGLWLDSTALWNGDLSGLAESTQRGAATAEHVTFVRKLAHSKR
jgi:Uma2 family endonuclease